MRIEKGTAHLPDYIIKVTHVQTSPNMCIIFYKLRADPPIKKRKEKKSSSLLNGTFVAYYASPLKNSFSVYNWYVRGQENIKVKIDIQDIINIIYAPIICELMEVIYIQINTKDLFDRPGD